MSNKTRLDVLLVEQGLLESRQKAQAVIMAGSVFVDGQRVDKPGTAVPNTAAIQVRGHALPYVSRGGLKLEKAMQTFKQMPEGSIVLFDLASGTPFNQMMMKSGGEEFPGLCGMNLPVLLEAMTMREAMKGSELVALLEESAKAAVVNIKSFFEP